MLDIFKEYFSTPDDLDYREEYAGIMSIEKLKKHKELIKALRKGPCPNGSIVQKTATTAMIELCRSKEESWHLATELEIRAASLAKKVRAMMRDVQQAVVKARGKAAPEWLQHLLDLEPTYIDVTDSAPVTDKPFTYAYHDQQELAWRLREGDDMRNRQWCRKIRRPGAAGDGDEAEAVWGDGETWKVPALTCGALSEKASHAKKAQPTLWSSPHMDG